MNKSAGRIPAIAGLALLALLTAATGAWCASVGLPSGADDEARKPADGLKRPKICLVLSGGGARGAAHVGVIKVLEELRVPIHCIAGTSMGSLIGAAYASGMSVAEMEQIDANISVELLFKDNPPRQEQSMRRKQDDYSIFFGPELGVVGSSVQLPKGVVTGVQLETVLRRLSKAKGYHRFDNLPIPFRAVATNLVTGKAVVFSEGELANVMRASMSVPGAVAPAEFGGMLLVDGMLTSNLPVQTARAMGADIIIAVNVGTPLLKRAQLTSILGVTGQMLSILTEQNVQASIALLKPTDILISPDLQDFSTGDFDNLPKIEPLGAAAARVVAERLAQLSLPPAEYAALRQRQMVVALPDTRPVDEIRFESLQRVNPRTALATMDTRPGQEIDQPTLDADLRRLYGSGDFERVNYRLLEEPGKRVLAVDAIEKTWGPNYLRLGLGLSSDFNGNAYFNVLASYRKTWLDSLGAQWRTSLQFGRTSGLFTEYYQPIDENGSFFLAPHAGVEQRLSDVYQGNDKVAQYQFTSTLAGIDVGMPLFKRYGELRVGLVGGSLSPKLDTGPPSLSPGASRIARGAFRVALLLDQADSVHFPRSGWVAGAHLYNSNRQLGADDAYTKWDVDGFAAFSFGEHTINLAAKAGGWFGSNQLPRYDQFQWGGFMQQSGYAAGQLLGENLQFARVVYYHRILRGSIFEGAYGGFSLEAGKIGKPLVAGAPVGLLRSASLFVAADTLVGPAYLGYGHAQDGNSRFYFFLGKAF